MKKQKLLQKLLGALLILTFALAGMAPGAALAEESTILISVSTNGTQADVRTDLPAVSDDGKIVAFSTDAENLVANDENYDEDVFVRNVANSTTICASVGLDGKPGQGASAGAAVSGNGRFVAFYSLADNLVEDDTNEAYDYFVRDLQAGVTTRVSVATGGGQASGGSVRPAISTDGRYVAFSAASPDLVSGDTNNKADVFVHDLQTGETTLVSKATNGTQGNGYSGSPAISADGRYVAFESLSTNFSASDTNGNYDIFVHDRQTGTTTMASVNNAGEQGDVDSLLPSISGDGRYVVFDSVSTNLVSGDSNDVRDIFVRDMVANTTQLVSVASDGTQGNKGSKDAMISDNGQYVVFDSYATNLVSGQDLSGLFLHDLSSGATTYVANGERPMISGTGRFITFEGNKLVPEDETELWDIYLRDRGAEPGTTYNVSGQVLSNGTGLAGVTVRLSDTLQAVTDADGKFTIAAVPVGTYTLTPSLEDYLFTPVALTVMVSSGDVIDQNFEAIPVVFVPVVQK